MASYTTQDSLLSVGRIGQAAWTKALAARGAHDPSRIVNLYHAYAPPLGLNPDLALAQGCEETGWFTSRRWVEQRNPCGLGIVADDTPGHVFDTQPHGIQAHLHHLCCYAYTLTACPVNHASTPDFRHAFHDGKPALSHLQDDARKWATKPGYVGRILAIANAVLAASDAPGATKGTTMPRKPPINTDHPSPNRGYPSGKHRPEAVVWHITQGTNSLPWLTSAASKASSNYLIARNGTIYQLVPPTESAWANGAVCAPDTTNPLIAAWRKEGVNFNQRTVSIEHEGKTSKGKGGSLTHAQIEATIGLTAWLCAEFGIAPDQTHILGHYEIDGCTRPDCPGFSGVEWTEWVRRVAAAVNPATPPPATAEPYARTYINDQGETITEINWRGFATAVEGYIVVDAGVTVVGRDGKTIYDQSLQQPDGFTGWQGRKPI